MVHQYGYGRNLDATHSSRPHPFPTSPLPSSDPGAGRSAPFLQNRQASSGFVYPPVMEEPEDDAGEMSTAHSHTGHVQSASYYPDPYRRSPQPPKIDTFSPRTSTSSGNPGPIKTLGNLFHLSQSHTQRSNSEVRGGAHRGTRDYPHLPDTDRDVETEERAALVQSDDEDERERGVMESPLSAISESPSSSTGGSGGGKKRLSEMPKGPRPSGPR